MLWVPLLAVVGCERVLDLGEAKVTGQCVPSQIDAFRLPSDRWGLAALYASRRLSDRADSALRLPPAWFLASAWEMSDFQCADYGPPYATVDERWAGDEGCLGIRSETAWAEICKLYPDLYDCKAYDGALAGDAPEQSVLALAWSAMAAHVLLSRFDVNPDAWARGAPDPLAVQRLTAALHHEGPWLWYAEDLLSPPCDRDVLGCLDGAVADHVRGVGEKLQRLGEAPCHRTKVVPADIEAFVAQLALRFEGWDWEAAERAALDSDRSLLGVVRAVEAQTSVFLDCPEQELWTWYQLPCP
ncbi:MAG: hypothetical protein KTR31_14560 [Myxococcales bacterium]|nr:hypothetical protein [Myxococcales bacterium]